MAEEEVATSTHTMVQRLEDLRIEHMSLINSLDSPKTEKSDIILKNIKCIDVGLDEAQLMMEFTLHLQNVENEKKRLNAQVKQLSEENDILRSELAASTEKLKIVEKMIENVDSNEKNLELAMCTPATDENNLQFLIDDTSIEPNSFAQDDYESDSTLTPEGFNHQNVHTDSDESETLSSFKKLQNQAMLYASEGKYKVALPLCQKAVDDLKKTTVGHFHPYITRMMSILSSIYGIQSQYKDATKLLHSVIREKTQPLTFDSN